MIVDGARIARGIEAEVEAEIQTLGRQPRLSVFTCEPTFATKRFLALKSATAERIGVTLSVEECPPERTTDEVAAVIKEKISQTDGIIVQLPFPPGIDISKILAAIPASHDVDAIGAQADECFASGKALVLPPVVGAIAEIIKRHHVDVRGKKTVVVGQGKLVGAPAAVWFKQQGAHVETINRKTEDIKKHTLEADILVLGAGVPGLITPDMIRDGAVIFDAGSSEDTGKLVGDADPSCTEKAALFTPVPGGIGPITVALIFQNLLTLISRREQKTRLDA
jgi:methylenetetrahydrofolate dehydrogenase (NADP+)/methenyltetrahydrofolate cyclohydrolase